MTKKHLAAALLSAAVLVACTVPTRADVILDTTGLGGTGNNVVFSSIASTNLILGHLNGSNNEVVRFRDLSGNGNFSGSANGNDIKIINTADLDIEVFDAANLVQLGTTRDIFSLKGTGSIFIRVTTLETDGTSKITNFGSLTASEFQLSNGQSGFDLQSINGEVITDVDVFVVGGVISDFEHYRIDVAPLAVGAPGPAMASGVPGLIAAAFGLWLYRRRRA